MSSHLLRDEISDYPCPRCENAVRPLSSPPPGAIAAETYFFCRSCGATLTGRELENKPEPDRSDEIARLFREDTHRGSRTGGGSGSKGRTKDAKGGLKLCGAEPFDLRDAAAKLAASSKRTEIIPCLWLRKFEPEVRGGIGADFIREALADYALAKLQTEGK